MTTGPRIVPSACGGEPAPDSIEGWLASSALAVVEMAEDETLPSTEGYELLDDRLYGDTRVAMLKTAASPAQD